MRDLQNEKRDHPHLPHSPASEVQGVKIVVISFQNIAKKLMFYCIGKKPPNDGRNLSITNTQGC